MNNYKKLLYCHYSLASSGGMERVLTTKVNFLSEKKEFEVHIAVKEKEERPFFPLSSSVIIHYLNAKSLSDYRKKLIQLIHELCPDYTISLFGEEASFLFKMSDKSKKILEFHFTRYYLTHLVNGIRNLKFRLLHKIKAKSIQMYQKYLMEKYETVVLLTQKDKELWSPNSKKISVIPNPISFKSDKITSLDNKKFVAMGRFTAQKGFDLLIESFNIIANRHPEWKLYIYGEGQDESLYQKMILNHHLEQQVHLCPPTKNVKNMLLQGDIFLFPSRYEGFGLVLTEALECGLPCIAFDCECGPSEIIENESSGFLVPVGHIQEFANKMELLINSPLLLKQMSINAKKRAKCFSPESIMRKWMNIFR